MLIDTGFADNYVDPKLVPPTLTRLHEKFSVRTPIGQKEGTEFVLTYKTYSVLIR